MLLQNRFNQIDAQIGSIQEQIRQLQDKLSDLQAYRQNLQSVEQAAESALSQIDTALMMLQHIDAEEIATFKSAVMAKFDSDIASLPSARPEVEPEIDPVQPDEPQAPAIEVDVVPGEVEAVPTDSPQTTADAATEPPASDGSVLTVNELEKVKYRKLQKLAKAHDVSPLMKGSAIAQALAGKVTQADLDALN